MNNETKKHAVIGIVAVSVGAALGWTLLVKPALIKATELEETERAHESMIAQHASFRQASNEQPISHVMANLDAAAGIIGRVVLETDIGTTLHSTLNTIAADSGMTITRIESTGAREYFEAIKGTEKGVSGQSHSVRLESEGPYSAAVRFIDSVQRTDPVLRCRTFRLVPSGSGTVRLSLEIDSYALTDVPGLGVESEGGAP